MRPTVFHIPICPFSQRLEILLALKGCSQEVHFQPIDITLPRPEWLLEKTGGTTSLPILEISDGSQSTIIKESMVILDHLERRFPEPPIAHTDPTRRAIEAEFCSLEGEFVTHGYRLLLNQDPKAREGMCDALLRDYRRMNELLLKYAPERVFLQEEFGWAEVVFTPMFMRFWCLEYYEDFHLPADGSYDRVRLWREACLAHPAAQQVCREQIIKLYYDYAMGAGNAALLPGRRFSSFVLQPPWPERPWPPKGKYSGGATDEALGLLPRPSVP